MKKRYALLIVMTVFSSFAHADEIFTTTTSYKPPVGCICNVRTSPQQGGNAWWSELYGLIPWRGDYFNQGCVPKTADAIPNTGFKFSHWEYGGDFFSYENPVTIDFLALGHGYSGMYPFVAVFDSLGDFPNIRLMGKYTCNENTPITYSCSHTQDFVWSVTYDNDIYYLTKDWEWLCGCESISWNGYIPKEGDIVVVEGAVSEATDYNDNPYINIEVEYLLPIMRPPSTSSVISTTTTTYSITPTTTLTSSISTTTTSSVCDYICPAELIYGEDSSETEVLGFIRDRMLSRTPEGRELIKLYYLWSPVIVKAMEGNEEFKEEMRQLIDGALMMIKGAVE